MEERKELINRYVFKGLSVQKACTQSGFSRSGYYYKASDSKRGKPATNSTQKLDGSWVDNSIIIEKIKEIINSDFIDYGYRKVGILLQKEYLINHKKVYRLMKENRLLNPKKRTPSSLKSYVKYSQPYPAYPFNCLEIDIKYIYIAGDNMNAYLITILDVLSRKALVWELDFSMKSDKVLKLFDKLIETYLQAEDLLNKKMSVILRSDNGSQFIAKKVQKYLKENHLVQEFIKPATPEQNGYIESFHSTVEKLVCQKFEFESLANAIDTFTQFYETYNNKRILACLDNKTPNEFLELFAQNLVDVTYSIKKKKQSFNFRKQQELKIDLLPFQSIFMGYQQNY